MEPLETTGVDDPPSLDGDATAATDHLQKPPKPHCGCQVLERVAAQGASQEVEHWSVQHLEDLRRNITTGPPREVCRARVARRKQSEHQWDREHRNVLHGGIE